MIATVNGSKTFVSAWVDGGWIVSVTHRGTEPGGQQRYGYVITDGRHHLASGDDLCSGDGETVSLSLTVRMLDALAGFLTAYGEASGDSENAELFPASLPRDLAYRIGEEIALEIEDKRASLSRVI